MRRLTLAVVLLSLAACSAGPPEDASGEQIYTELCARCHADDLSGGLGPALGPGSSAAGESDEYLEFTISNGRGRMPSFRSLDEDQLARLIEYMRDPQGE